MRWRMFHERHLMNKYMKILIKKSKFGPEMPPECIYSLHFFKNFWGACPPTPLVWPREALCLRHSPPGAFGARKSHSYNVIFIKKMFQQICLQPTSLPGFIPIWHCEATHWEQVSNSVFLLNLQIWPRTERSKVIDLHATIKTTTAWDLQLAASAHTCYSAHGIDTQ